MFLIYNHTHACLIDEIDLMVVEQDRKEALLQAMANDYMRKILLSTVSCARPIEEIARENGIPISTCYRRVRELIHSSIASDRENDNHRHWKEVPDISKLSKGRDCQFFQLWRIIR